MDSFLGVLARASSALADVSKAMAVPRATPDPERGAALSDRIGALLRRHAGDKVLEGQAQQALDRAKALNSPAAQARIKLEEAERKMNALRLAAQLAAAGGDTKALERIAREAATLARQLGTAARGPAVPTKTPAPVPSDIKLRSQRVLGSINGIITLAEQVNEEAEEREAEERAARRHDFFRHRLEVSHAWLIVDGLRITGPGGAAPLPVAEPLSILT